MSGYNDVDGEHIGIKIMLANVACLKNHRLGERLLHVVGSKPVCGRVQALQEAWRVANGGMRSLLQAVEGSTQRVYTTCTYNDFAEHAR